MNTNEEVSPLADELQDLKEGFDDAVIDTDDVLDDLIASLDDGGKLDESQLPHLVVAMREVFTNLEAVMELVKRLDALAKLRPVTTV